MSWTPSDPFPLVVVPEVLTQVADPVCSAPARPGPETYMYIAQDGRTQILGNTRTRTVLWDEGTGMPPIQYITQRGPYQHGETPVDFFLRPRTLQCRIRHKFGDRSTYYVGRQQLMSTLSPARGPSGVLRKIYTDGTMRDIGVLIDEGPRFQARKLDTWDEWAIDEILRFTAFNPVFYGPTVQTLVFTAAAELVFPITFPITFGALDGSQVINYTGDWLEYPAFFITGPITGLKIENTTTGEKLEFTGSVAAGRTLIINLQYGIKSIELDDGTNYVGYLTSDSDLAEFHIQPGNNTITAYGTGVSAATAVEMRWYLRYLGI